MDSFKWPIGSYLVGPVISLTSALFLIVHAGLVAVFQTHQAQSSFEVFARSAPTVFLQMRPALGYSLKFKLPHDFISFFPALFFLLGTNKLSILAIYLLSALLTGKDISQGQRFLSILFYSVSLTPRTLVHRKHA